MKRANRTPRNDVTIKNLRKGIDALPKEAAEKAYATGGSVVFLEGGAIVRRFKDGKKVAVSSHSSPAKRVAIKKKNWKI